MDQGSNSPVDLERLQFYVTAPHACSYLPEREAVTLFADPSERLDNGLYSRLSLLGFRRSGAHLYRPHCATCRACVPVRIPVAEFTPDRAQRRAWARNRGVEVQEGPVRYEDEHFALYRRYIRSRHPGGGMDNDAPENYLSFISSPWSATRLYEFREEGRLLAVAVTDHLADGLSAVYTYFEPDEPRRSLGVFAVLWQVEHARRLGLAHVYLGYWIRETRKMAYKARFRPLEAFDGHRWRRLQDRA